MKLKKSNRIYDEVKKFYDINPEGIYPYQNLEYSGRDEYLQNCSSHSEKFEKWQKINVSTKLSEKIINTYGEKDFYEGFEIFVKRNHIIFYYDYFIDFFSQSLSERPELRNDLIEVFKKIIKETENSEALKASIIVAVVLNDGELNKLCRVFSCHNEYIFYYIQILKHRNENHKIFHLCKNSYGYGRILSVMSLNVVNKEMRKWLIEEGLNNNEAISEMLKYTLLSYNFEKYIDENEYNKDKFEKIAMYVGRYLFNEYEINEINIGLKICNYIINTVSEKFGGIYSLYCIAAIMNFAEDFLLYNTCGKDNSRKEEFLEICKEMLYKCRNICKDKRWTEVLSYELINIDMDADIILACAERIKYKLKKAEFKNLFIRNFNSPFIYNYAFSCENKSLERLVLTEGLNKLNKSYILSGQDSIKIEDIKYNEIEHVCYFIIISNIKFKGNEDIFKSINMEALNSPVIETRKCAIDNLNIIKEILDDYDKDTIIEIKDREVNSILREELDILIGKKNYKRKKYIDINKYAVIKPHVKDVLLSTLEVEGVNFVDMSEINNELLEKSIIYIVPIRNNSDINTVTTYNGYVIGYLSKSNNEIIYNLVRSNKYIYGAVKTVNEDYSSISIDVYLSYQDVVDEIESTLSLLTSYRKADFIQ